MAQQTIYDYIKPAYGDTKDEILRHEAEYQLELKICLERCCGKYPNQMFKSCHEYYVICPVCGKRTGYHKKNYQAKQAWNLGKYKEVEDGKKQKQDA